METLNRQLATIFEVVTVKNVYMKNERRVFVYLTKLGIVLTRQFSFPDSVYKYDVYLPQLNVLIEYDGQQHYYPVKLWGGVTYLNKVIKNDIEKTELARINNIPLIRIPYTKDDVLEEYLLFELSKIYRYRKDGKFYRNFVELMKDNKIHTDATVTDFDRYKTINIK